MAVRAMPEVEFGIRDIKVYANGGDLTTGDTTNPIRIPNFPDKSVQVSGTFAGATITIQGSNNTTTYVTLHKPDGTDAAFTADGMCQILENPLLIRASAAAGSGTGLTVTFVCSTQRS